MVISHILGGIGNQMFQYAAGRALALTNEQKQLVDLNDFTNYQLHNGFELNRVFNVNTGRADVQIIDELLKWRANGIVKKVLRRPHFEWLRGKAFVVEPSFNYWPGFLDLTDDCYLFGYWQSESYFKSFENIIRQDFIFRQQLTGQNSNLANEIAKTQSVSLHVRRGDYVSDSKTGNIMDICSLEYYSKAIKYIAERIESPVFYIFSDDITWVKKYLAIDFSCIYVKHNQKAESYRDMQLMSLCAHNIIANSSFSWWGAWLNSNPDKLVIAPTNWFLNGTDDRDLIPEKWVRL